METYLYLDSLVVIIVRKHACECYFITEILNLKTYLRTTIEPYENKVYSKIYGEIESLP